MQYFPSRRFDKQFHKLSQKIKNQTIERIQLFIENPFSPILNNHTLGGKYLGCQSINVTGDIRIIYEIVGDNLAHFLEIGSHSELYK
jgi:addiction module RelE/StbE family toxin